jgi:hypothetical protein
MARIEPGSDDPDNLVARLAVEVLVIGPIVGAYLGLDPPEDLISKLFLTCYEKLYLFDESRSLRAWIWSYARRVGLEVRRQQRPLGSELVAEPEDLGFHEELISTFSMDDPSVLEDELTEQVEQYLERQRLTWPRKREASWIEALRAARHQDLYEARAEVRKTALYDVFIASKTRQLVVPWKAIVREVDREMLAAEYGVTREAIDQRISRFQRKVQGRVGDLAGAIRKDIGFILN